MILLQGIYFLLLIILFIYLPGRFLFRISKSSISDQMIIFPLELGIGSAFFIACVYLLSWIHSDILYLFILIPLIFLEMKHIVSQHEKVRFLLPKVEFSIILIGSLTALYITGRSGLEVNGQLVFYGVNATDAVFHISLIGNLMHHFPPTHAGMAGVALHGYNFLYDLFVSSFAKFFYFNPFDLFFRYFSLFVALFYGFSSLALARFLKMDGIATKLFIFLAYFVQGTTFIFHLLGIHYDPGIVQPIANIVDPSVLFSISLFYVSFILIFSLHKWQHVIITAVMLSVIPMIKIYTAFLLFAALGVVTLSLFLLKRKEKWKYASLIILAGVLGGIIYAPINLGVGKLVFTPFLLYTHFLESYAPLNHSDWFGRMLVYFEHKNYLRIIQNYLKVLALFFIPSLSLRLFGLFSLRNMFKKAFYTPQHVFILTAITCGIVIPSFFIQNIAVFVIIQFLWITYFLLLIPAAYGLATVYQHLPKIGKGLLVIIVIGLSLPDLFTLLMLYSSHPTIIPQSIVALSKEIGKTVPQSEGILVVNTRREDTLMQTNSLIPIVSAISEHDVYYEPEVLEFSGLDHEVTKRRDLISEVDQVLSQCGDKVTADTKLRSLLGEAKSSYLMTFDEKSCLSTLPSFTLVSEKGEAALYKVR